MKAFPVMVFALALGGMPVASRGASATRFQTLYRFTGSPGGSTPQGLTAGPNGVLYGATAYGGTYNLGTIFELQPPATAGSHWTETVLYNFSGYENSDGENPVASPTVGPNGVLYGTTESGGYLGTGTVYQLQPPAAPGAAWTETVLFGFVDSDNGGSGYFPTTGVVIGSGGEIYGTTSGGGQFYYGAAFELVPPASGQSTWTEYVIYSFTGDGREPTGLTMGPGGVLYGATNYGGSAGAGTVFELMPPATQGGAWSQVILHTFGGGTDGFAPLQGPVLGRDGNLYGTTSGGGSVGSGTVYVLTPGANGIWSKTILYDFAQSGDGKIPNSPLIVGNGLIYGTTASGTGTGNGGGTIFALHKPSTAGTAWTETVLHEFNGLGNPIGALVRGSAGVVYGTTAAGPGPHGAGSVYSVK